MVYLTIYDVFYMENIVIILTVTALGLIELYPHLFRSHCRMILCHSFWSGIFIVERLF